MNKMQMMKVNVKFESQIICCEGECPEAAVMVVCSSRPDWYLPFCTGHIRKNAAAIAVAVKIIKLPGFNKVTVEALFDGFVTLDTSVWSDISEA